MLRLLTAVHTDQSSSADVRIATEGDDDDDHNVDGGFNSDGDDSVMTINS